MTFAGYETDRGAFFGRAGRARAPKALATRGRALRGRAGAVLDPIMSVMARVELEPKRTVTLAFVTTVGRVARAALESRATVRLDARGPLGLPGRRAGERAAHRSSPARARALADRAAALLRAALRRSDAPRAAGRAGGRAPVQASPLGARHLGRRPDRARARERRRGAHPARDASRPSATCGRAASASISSSSTSRPRGTSPREPERCGSVLVEADVDGVAQPARRHLRARGRSAPEATSDGTSRPAARVVLDTRRRHARVTHGATRRRVAEVAALRDRRSRTRAADARRTAARAALRQRHWAGSAKTAAST